MHFYCDGYKLVSDACLCARGTYFSVIYDGMYACDGCMLCIMDACFSLMDTSV